MGHGKCLAVDLRLDNHEVNGEGGSLHGSAGCGAGTSDGLDGGMQEDRRHLSQLIVELYGWSHLAARRVASRL